jgi:hypothetical protein
LKLISDFECWKTLKITWIIEIIDYFPEEKSLQINFGKEGFLMLVG